MQASFNPSTRNIKRKKKRVTLNPPPHRVNLIIEAVVTDLFSGMKGVRPEPRAYKSLSQ
jgi:hypothetical protein